MVRIFRFVLIVFFATAFPICVLADEFHMDVPNYNQRTLGYNSGCEIVSVSMMINYTTEVKTSVLISKMPLSDDPYQGYRGNVKVLSSGFTIFPSALKKLTTEYLGSAIDMTRCTMDQLVERLGQGAPIVVWVNGLGFNVHAVCLTGYDEKGFYYNDPWTGKKDVFIGYGSFYQIWNKPIVDKQKGISYSTRKALSYNPTEEQLKPQAPKPTEVPKPTEAPKPTAAPKPTEAPTPEEPKPAEEAKPTETAPEEPAPEEPKPEEPAPEEPKPEEPTPEVPGKDILIQKPTLRTS